MKNRRIQPIGQTRPRTFKPQYFDPSKDFDQRFPITHSTVPVIYSHGRADIEIQNFGTHFKILAKFEVKGNKHEVAYFCDKQPQIKSLAEFKKLGRDKIAKTEQGRKSIALIEDCIYFAQHGLSHPENDQADSDEQPLPRGGCYVPKDYSLHHAPLWPF